MNRIPHVMQLSQSTGGAPALSQAVFRNFQIKGDIVLYVAKLLDR
jgi:hypothetical protein